MKKILFILMTIIFIGCDSSENGFPVLSNGEIIRIEKYTDEIEIYVLFKNSQNTNYIFKFIGSDTCRVGQKIHLQ